MTRMRLGRRPAGRAPNRRRPMPSRRRWRLGCRWAADRETPTLQRARLRRLMPLLRSGPVPVRPRTTLVRMWRRGQRCDDGWGDRGRRRDRPTRRSSGGLRLGVTGSWRSGSLAGKDRMAAAALGLDLRRGWPATAARSTHHAGRPGPDDPRPPRRRRGLMAGLQWVRSNGVSGRCRLSTFTMRIGQPYQLRRHLRYLRLTFLRC